MIDAWLVGRACSASYLHAGHGKGRLLHIELLVVQLVALRLVEPLLLEHLHRVEKGAPLTTIAPQS